jgi:hypothetical protein
MALRDPGFDKLRSDARFQRILRSDVPKIEAPAGNGGIRTSGAR